MTGYLFDDPDDREQNKRDQQQRQKDGESVERERQREEAPDAEDQYERLKGAFERFHAENPDVYRLFCKFVSELLERGFKRYGAKGVMERVRWHTATATSTSDDGGFKIANAHTSFYARMWLDSHPDHQTFFATAEQRSKGREAA